MDGSPQPWFPEFTPPVPAWKSFPRVSHPGEEILHLCPPLWWVPGRPAFSFSSQGSPVRGEGGEHIPNISEKA